MGSFFIGRFSFDLIFNVDRLQGYKYLIGYMIFNGRN